MKKNKLIALIFLLVITVATIVACDKEDEKIEIALVTDVGNIDDKSFNEGSWKGVVKYAVDNKKSYAYYRPSEDSTASRVETIETAIDKGAKVVVCPGFLFEESIYEIQDDYPEVSFLLLDGTPHNADYSDYKTAKNVHCILYNEEQAGYFAGYGAVIEGYRNLGYIGGVGVPAVMRFGWGYIQGANDAAIALGLEEDAVKMKYNYAGSFVPTTELGSKMTGWYTAGTDVVFACGGAIYLNVTAAAEAANKKVIGVDVDQSAESKTIITSAMKELTTSVVLALEAFYKNDGSWDSTRAGKVATLGAKDDCVGLPTAEGSWRFEKFTVDQYKALFEQVKTGKKVINSDINVKDNSNEFVMYKGTTEVAGLITHVVVDFAA